MNRRAAHFLCLLPLIVFAGEVLYAFCFRVGYPFGLEWMEGDLLIAAHRLAHGQAVYSRPDQWIAYFYPPLYLILWAPLVYFCGPAFWTGRLLSMLASVVTCIALGGFVRARTGGWRPAWLAMGLFWGFYQYTGQWLDLCRVDALMLAMAAAGIGAYAKSRNTGRMIWRVASVLLLGSSPLAKQNGSAFLLAVGLFDMLVPSPSPYPLPKGEGSPSPCPLPEGEGVPLTLPSPRGRGYFPHPALSQRGRVRWWRRAEFLLAGGAVSLVWIALGQWLTEGWYWDYMYAMPARLEHRNLFALIFVKPTLKYALPWVLGIVVGLAMAARGPRRRERALEALLLIFGAAASLPVTFKYGAYYNNLLPLMLAMCMVGGVLLGDAWSHSRLVLQRAATLLVAAQVLVLLAVNRPGDWRPNRQNETVRQAERVVPELLAQSGERVWVLSHPYLNLQRGAPVYVREFAALEFARCGGQLPEKWYALIREHHYDAIIADYPLNLEFDLFAAIARHYQLYSTIRYGDEELPERRRALAPKSGAFTRPTYYWIPREELGQSRIPAGGSR